MMTLKLCLFFAGINFGIGNPLWRKSTIVDLTYDLDDHVMYFPLAMPFNDSNAFHGPNGVGVWMNVNNFCTTEHAGTHVDAPFHFYNDGKSIEKLSVDNFVGTAIVIDITEKVKTDVNAEPTTKDLENWEKKCNKKIPKGAIVLLRTGYQKYWGNKTAFLGTNENDATKLRFPGFGKESAQWLVDNRDIKGVGTETVSFDKGIDQHLYAHQIILGKGLYGIENIANMDKLPECGSRIYVLPLKIKGGTASPARIIAELD